MNKNIFSLRGKVVVLTGGLGLLGLSYVKALKNQGAIINVIDLLDADKAKKILKRKNVFYFSADITNKDSLLKIKRSILKKFRKIDVLINNAAWNPKVEGFKNNKKVLGAFENFPLEQWDKELAINLTGTMLCCQVFGSAMKSGSSIINVSSVYGMVAPDQSIYPRGFVKPATYGVSKGGVISLTKYLAVFWGKRGIRVNALVPGGVYNGQNKEFVKRYSIRTPLGRMAKNYEYDGAMVFLASDASSYMTGSCLVMDGGWTAW